MRGAALSDTHLGFRAFSRTTEGRNTREVDVEKVWYEAVEGVVRAQPDIVTFAGDLFQHPGVSDYAKRAFLDGILRILVGTRAFVIIEQGNHDAGRTAPVLTPLALAEVVAAAHRRGARDRVFVVTKPERIVLDIDPKDDDPFTERPPKRVSVACLPYVSREDAEDFRLETDPTADVNILVMHAAARGTDDADSLPRFYGADGALNVGKEAERWDVIHVGDYHEFTRLHPSRLVFYPGSLERTSNDIWHEQKAKGWVLWDTEDQSLTFMEVKTRPMYDLVGDGQANADGVNRLLNEILDMEPTEGALVRLKVEDFPREEKQHIDWSLVNRLKTRCTHFYLDLRYARPTIAELGDRRERRGETVGQAAAAFFSEDDEAVRALALYYLDAEADAEEATDA